jgi:hypothetical protein
MPVFRETYSETIGKTKRELFFHDEPVCRLIDLVGLRAFEEVKCIDLHIDELDIIERFALLLSVLFPENDNAVLHLFAAGNILHTVQKGTGGNEDYGKREKMKHGFSWKRSSTDIVGPGGEK